jgi:hypothetical protein
VCYFWEILGLEFMKMLLNNSFINNIKKYKPIKFSLKFAAQCQNNKEFNLVNLSRRRDVSSGSYREELSYW